MLRKEFAVGRPADVPDAPTHGSLLAQKQAEGAEGADGGKTEKEVVA